MFLNEARTTPEFPSSVRIDNAGPGLAQLTVSLPDLAPDNAVLGSTDFGLGAVHECDALAQVELGLLRSGDTLQREKAHIGVGGALAALVAKVLALNVN